MEYNESLSARIKRRNKQGFNGVGTHKLFLNVEGNIKDNSYGAINTHQTNLINYAKKHGFKNNGSKTIKQLERYI